MVASGSVRTVSDTIYGSVLEIGAGVLMTWSRAVLCGRWERFPREFAKCRRCRKAKYCGKECQSTAWSEGHRFWCSAKEPEEDGDHHHHGHGHGHGGEHSRSGGSGGTGSGGAGNGSGSATTAAGASSTATTAQGRAERREARERERQARAMAAELRLAQEQRGVQMVRTNANAPAQVVATTQTQTTADPGPSNAANAGGDASRSSIPDLAAALVDGTWTYRPGTVQAPQWLNEGAGRGTDRSQRVASLLRQEPDVTRRQLARELMNSRALDSALPGHPPNVAIHTEMADAPTAITGDASREDVSEDVDMLVD